MARRVPLPATKSGYEIELRAFRGFTGKPLRAVTLRDLLDFAASLGDAAPATAARRLSAVKSLIAFAHRVGYLPFDIGAPVQLPTVKDRLAERIMSEWDVQQMLGLEKQPRNAALLRLIYGAGLRVSEVCGLCWRDLTARDDAGQVNVLGKGGKTRAVLQPKSLWDRVNALRGDAGAEASVFRSSKSGEALQRMQVHRIVKAAAKRAGLSAGVSTTGGAPVRR
ncbi:MAG TPA: tyrosine-type recombinase/integrase [Acetobacteraceae bacterium]|nr:tyrosine-type recombinase/integrase [Acetobacteraceae bacterium]